MLRKCGTFFVALCLFLNGFAAVSSFIGGRWQDDSAGQPLIQRFFLLCSVPARIMDSLLDGPAPAAPAKPVHDSRNEKGRNDDAALPSFTSFASKPLQLIAVPAAAPFILSAVCLQHIPLLLVAEAPQAPPGGPPVAALLAALLLMLLPRSAIAEGTISVRRFEA